MPSFLPIGAVAFAMSVVMNDVRITVREPLDNSPLLPPEDCFDRETFACALEELRAAGGWSLRSLAEACQEKGHPIVHGTVEGWFKGRVMRRDSEPAFRVVLSELGVTSKDDQDRWLATARKLRGRPRPLIGGEPYRGLESYEATDAEIFYGWQALVRQILEEVRVVQGLGGGAVLLAGASGAASHRC
ncbi:hypothetical protein ACFQY7_18060 [Actinomadura luteofluorescens]|uniref:nSTAND1 domain-containing NTPase n=1 Tax=Actinomadura luteofluorescens TaxID=46163 RepID=UPI00362935E0